MQVRLGDGRARVRAVEQRVEDPDDRPPLEEPRAGAVTLEPQAALADEEDELGRLAFREETLASLDVLLFDDGGHAVDDPGLEIGRSAGEDREKELARRALKARIRARSRLPYRERVLEDALRRRTERGPLLAGLLHRGREGLAARGDARRGRRARRP